MNKVNEQNEQDQLKKAITDLIASLPAMDDTIEYFTLEEREAILGAIKQQEELAIQIALMSPPRDNMIGMLAIIKKEVA